MTMARESSVLVVGAGPVGVVASLACAQRGFRVTLLEAEATVETSPRAATTHPSTLELIAGLGLLEHLIAEGLVARYFQFWDRPTRTLICEFDHDVLRDETPYPFVVQTEQHKLANMGIEKLRAFADCAVHFSTRVTSVEQTADVVRVSAQAPDGPRDFSAHWVIGADGGRSSVRKLVGIEFEGYTWPERFVVLTTTDDFERALGCCYRSYFADPDEWTNLFKVAGDDHKGRWRAVFPTRIHETDEEALSDDEVRARMGRLLPAAEGFAIVHRNLYKVHQRVAKSFRKGRVFLAGDAAHVNNPIGGLGLNCGIHDAIELAETLRTVGLERADEALLERYERRRRPINIRYVQEQTVVNKKRLEERDPRAREARFAELRSIAADNARHKQFLMRTSLLESLRNAD
jgi:3-(3-hydroxy-phenyl)propionate hydroxylase